MSLFSTLTAPQAAYLLSQMKKGLVILTKIIRQRKEELQKKGSLTDEEEYELDNNLNLCDEQCLVDRFGDMLKKMGAKSIAYKDVSGFASDMVWVALIETGGGVVKEGVYEPLPLCKPSLPVGPFRIWKIHIDQIYRT